MSEQLTRYAPPADPEWDFWPLVGPRGDGKTHSALQALHDLLPTHESAIVIAPSHRCFPDFARMLAHGHEVELAMKRESGWALLSRDRRVRFFSAQDDLDRLRGLRFEIAVMDEPLLYAQRADRIAGVLRVSCRVRRIITTSGVW